MEYLVRLVTPKEGIVLEPFAGSGTTLIACKQQGFNYIGIEREQEYCDIAEARLKAVQVQGELF
jgi:site-specific DNA-methyltransferase (adenine-specific)